jgi:transcriptional regulator with PAS, ATPase and Fis domain
MKHVQGEKVVERISQKSSMTINSKVPQQVIFAQLLEDIYTEDVGAICTSIELFVRDAKVNIAYSRENDRWVSKIVEGCMKVVMKLQTTANIVKYRKSGWINVEVRRRDVVPTNRKSILLKSVKKSSECISAEKDSNGLFCIVVGVSYSGECGWALIESGDQENSQLDGFERSDDVVGSISFWLNSELIWIRFVLGKGSSDFSENAQIYLITYFT